MTDRKISEFPVATAVTAVDIIPVVAGGVNQALTVGVLALNMPNVGNKGITTHSIVAGAVQTLPLTKTVVYLTDIGVNYILPVGNDGQVITIIAPVAGVVSIVSGYATDITFSVGGSATLIYSTALTKWTILSLHNASVEVPA
jgi:hypothetical protein